jgi:HSP20 family protein
MSRGARDAEEPPGGRIVMSITRDWVSSEEHRRESAQAILSPGEASVEALPGTDWSPAVDILETSDRIVLRADLPGIAVSQLEVKIENERLVLKGERSFDPGARREEFRRIERPFGRFARVFALPRSVEPSGIRAEVRNGVLEVILPKCATTQTRPIKVEVR